MASLQTGGLKFLSIETSSIHRKNPQTKSFTFQTSDWIISESICVADCKALRLIWSFSSIFLNIFCEHNTKCWLFCCFHSGGVTMETHWHNILYIPHPQPHNNVVNKLTCHYFPWLPPSHSVIGEWGVVKVQVRPVEPESIHRSLLRDSAQTGLLHLHTWYDFLWWCNLAFGCCSVSWQEKKSTAQEHLQNKSPSTRADGLIM